jgi:hypothetical protein
MPENEPDRGSSGTHVQPPRRALMMPVFAAGFSAAAIVAMLLGECDIGGILAAIAFVFALMSGFGGVARIAGSDPDEGGSGSHVQPPKPLPPLPPLLEAGAAGSLLGSMYALQVERCQLATVLAIIALILLLLAILRPRR